MTLPVVFTANGPTGYNLTKSLRFRSSASATLSRTPSSASNQQKWTLSTWVKRGTIYDATLDNYIFGAGSSGSNRFLFGFGNTTENLAVVATNSGSNVLVLNTTPVYRDPSAWYHMVLSVDTTQATASNRVRLYINGTEVTAFSTATYPAQNTNLVVNATNAHAFGSRGYAASDYYDGYMAETNFVDGQQLTPSSFGSTNAQTGVWQPAKYTGTYGTNGFYLPFTDNSALTSGSNAGLGKDFSGNGNYWNTNNISITSGSTYDSMTDVPTLTSATQANYCVLSPIDTYDNPPTEGNLRRTGVGHGGSPWSTCRGTLGVSSGKWYFEATLTGSTGSVGNNMVGVMTTTSSALNDAYGGSTTRSYQANGGLQGDNSTGTVSSATSGDVIMIAFDVDAGKLWVGKNGTWMNSGVPASGTGNVFTALPTSPIVPQVSMYGNTGDNYGWFTNFGQRPFAYTPPTGFVALNTYNLPTPTIGATASSQANKYFDVSLWTGNGTSQSITNSGSMQPDFVWYKGRSTTYNHGLFDVIRGTLQRLSSNTTAAESTTAGSLTAFNSNGFSIGDDAGVNQNTDSYVGWQWKASNTTAVSNTAGSITSQVSANTSAGFSVVTYTGNDTSGATVGHGLGVAPSMFIVKTRTQARGWNVYHTSLGNTKYIQLQQTGAAVTSSAWWNNTSPSSTTFTLGNDPDVNGSTQNYVAYCFSEIAGYSKFGSYTGNGSTDGPFVYTGFKPRYVMFKRTDSTGSWHIFDGARNPYNLTDTNLYANGTNTDTQNNAVDFLSNGFKCRSSDTDDNASGGTVIYMAFAENPFKYSLAR